MANLHFQLNGIILVYSLFFNRVTIVSDRLGLIGIWKSILVSMRFSVLIECFFVVLQLWMIFLTVLQFLMHHTVLSMSRIRNFKEKDNSTFHHLEYFLQEILMVLTLFFYLFQTVSTHNTHVPTMISIQFSSPQVLHNLSWLAYKGIKEAVLIG